MSKALILSSSKDSMRYFSPNSITRPMFRYIESGLKAKQSPIPIPCWWGRPYEITPVLVTAVKGDTFSCHFLSNPFYRLDLEALEGSLFREVYTEEGAYDADASSRRISYYSGKCYEYLLHDVYMPNALEAGDILLCTRGRERRKDLGTPCPV